MADGRNKKDGEYEEIFSLDDGLRRGSLGTCATKGRMSSWQPFNTGMR